MTELRPLSDACPFPDGLAGPEIDGAKMRRAGEPKPSPAGFDFQDFDDWLKLVSGWDKQSALAHREGYALTEEDYERMESYA